MAIRFGDNINVTSISATGSIFTSDRSLESNNSVVNRDIGDTRYGSTTYAYITSNGIANVSTTNSSIFHVVTGGTFSGLSASLNANSLYEITSVITLTGSGGIAVAQTRYSGICDSVAPVDIYSTPVTLAVFTTPTALFSLSGTLIGLTNTGGSRLFRNFILKTTTAGTLEIYYAAYSSSGVTGLSTIPLAGRYLITRRLA
jgi:hypothetical protein